MLLVSPSAAGTRRHVANRFLRLSCEQVDLLWRGVEPASASSAVAGTSPRF